VSFAGEREPRWAADGAGGGGCDGGPSVQKLVRITHAEALGKEAGGVIKLPYPDGYADLVASTVVASLSAALSAAVLRGSGDDGGVTDEASDGVLQADAAEARRALVPVPHALSQRYLQLQFAVRQSQQWVADIVTLARDRFTRAHCPPPPHPVPTLRCGLPCAR
jgi:hypothetical protein